MLQKLYLVGFLFAIAATTAQAQVNITATPPPSTAALNVCGAPALFSVKITGVGPQAANNGRLSVQLPVGVRYVPNTIAYTSGATGSITETAVNTSLTTFDIANVAVGGSIELTYQATADCRRINQSVNSTDYTLASSAGTQLFPGGTAVNPSYNVRYAAMNIVGITNNSYNGTAGTTFTRTIKVLNGGFGSVPEIKLDETNSGGMTIESISVAGAASITSSATLPSGSTTYTVAGFAGNGQFDNNETITITETLKLPATACGGTAGSALTNYKAYYGCYNETICPTTNSTDISSSTTATVSWSGALPGTGAGLSLSAPIAAANACFSTNVSYTLTVTNNGTDAAESVKVYFDARDANAQYLTNFTVNGAPATATVTTAPSSGVSGCFTTLPSGALAKGYLVLSDIPSGTSITISFEGARCCNSNFCRASGTIYAGFVASATYRDGCTVSKSAGGGVYGVPADSYKSQIIEGFIVRDILTVFKKGSTGSYCADIDLILPEGDNTGFLDFKLAMPAGTSLTTGGAATMSGITGNNWPVAAGYPVKVNDTIIARFNLADMPAGFSIAARHRRNICIPIFAPNDASPCDGTFNVTPTMSARYTPSTSCAGCALSLYCGGNRIPFETEIECGGPPAVVGAEMLDLKLERTSFGAADNNNDNIPDVSGSLNTNILRKQDVILGDTIALESGAVVKDAIGGTTFSNGYFGVKFRNSAGNLNPVPIAASAKIYDFSAGVWLTITGLTPIVNTQTGANDLIVYDLSAALPAGFVFAVSDTIRFYATYHATAQGIGASLIKVNTFADMGNAPRTAFTGVSIGYRPAYIYMHAYDVTTLATVNKSADPCGTTGYILAQATAKLAVDYGGELFDNEVRKIGYETTWAVNLPTGVTYDRAEVLFAGDYGRQATTFAPIVATSTINNIATFNLQPFYSEFGGTVPNWEDRSSVQLKIYYNTGNPACAALTTVQQFTSNRIFNNPIASVVAGEQKTTNFSFKNSLEGGPGFFLTTNSDLTATGDTVIWKLKVANAGSGLLPNTWLAKKSGISGVTITSIQPLDCATGAPTGAAIPLDAKGYYKLGNIGGGGKCFAIKATYQSCVKDSINLWAGFACTGYPTDISNPALLCGTAEQKLYVRPVQTQLQQIITAQPTTDVNLCATFNYNIAVSSVQKGSVNSIINRFAVLPGQGVTVVAGSSQVEYPNGSGTWITVADPSFAANVYTWVPTNDAALAATLGAKGLLGVDSALVGKNRYNLRFTAVTTPCNFKSGIVFLFQTNGKKGCNETIFSTDQITTPVNVAGAPTNTNSYTVILQTTPMQPCNGTTGTVKFKAINQGGLGLSGSNEFIELVFYDNITLPGGLTATHNPPTAPVDIETVSGGTVARYQMPAGVAVGDSVVFTVDVATVTPPACGFTGIRIDASTNTLFSATCSTTSQSCNLAKTTGNDGAYIPLLRPKLIIQSLTATAEINPPLGETVHATVTFKNNGVLPILASSPFNVKFYHDADLSGTVTAGDQLLATSPVSATILVGATLVKNINIDVPPGQACPLLAIIEESACYCNQTAVTTTNVPFAPASYELSTCSTIAIQIGEKPLPGYTYTWTAVTTGALSWLNAANISNPTFSKPGAFGEDVIFKVFINRGTGCIAEQEVIIHLVSLADCPRYEGSIGNYVWYDDNANGSNDEAPARGINGIRVELFDAGADLTPGTSDDTFVGFKNTANDVSGNPGYYLFTPLPNGVYYVQFPTAFVGTSGLTTQNTASGINNNSDPSPTTGKTNIIQIDIAAGGLLKDNLTIDAGFVPISAIGDRVWFDENKDGVQNANEVTPIANVIVKLYDSVTNALISTDTTDANGNYLFTKIPAGNYYIVFEKPISYTGSPQIPNTTDGSDADALTGRTQNFTLGLNQVRLDIDAGFFPTPLPVTMLYFETKLNNCEVELRWATASELNNKRFVIMRSTDGKNYSIIGEVNGNGTTAVTHYYRFSDKAPKTNNYYTLVQYDFDGTSTPFAAAKSINTFGCYDETANGISIMYPNPSSETFVNMKFYTTYGDETIRIEFTDVLGRTAYITTMPITTGANIIKVPLADLPTGSYSVRIFGESWNSAAQKFVRTKL